MKILNSNLYLEFAEAVECGIGTDAYLRKAKSEGIKCYNFIPDPADGRKVLLEYETLKPEHKEKVQRRWGNPYEYCAKEPLRKMVVRDIQAHDFYNAYKYEGNKSLPFDTVEKYTRAASWLKMLSQAEANKKEIKKNLGLSLADFWVKVTEIIEADAIDLPTSYKRLREKIKEFETAGYPSLIHKKFGVASNVKVKDELSQSLLLELISLPYHDDDVICRKYNTWAVENGYEQIVPMTVRNWRTKNAAFVTGSKNGNKDWYNTYGKQIMRMRPSAPLLLIGSDDNDLDLYFQSNEVNKKGHSTINYFNRFKLIVVMDAFNDYILGYAVAETVTTDLIKLAYLDAMHHVQQLTGGWYLPFQVQTDRWGKGTLDEWYNQFAIYTPATARVARAKYIEQAFGTRWHQQLRLYPNYAGNNVTAQSKINEDDLQAKKHLFPSTDQAHYQIEHFINSMRTLVDEKTGLSKQDQWLQAFQQSEKSKAKAISDMQTLAIFGVRHPYTNKITNAGITPQINCVDRTYEMPADLYLETIGADANVIYDPLDYSRILIETSKHRFIAHTYEKLPSAIADFKPGDRSRLHARIEEKKNHVAQIQARKDQRQDILQRNRLNAESLLQAGVMPKELMHGAAQLYHETKNNKGIEYDALDQM